MLIDWFTVGAQALNFLILVWLMKRYLYAPILQAIDAREKRVAAELADADAKKAEAQKERDEFQRKNEEFDQQRAALARKAAEEAETAGRRLLDDAREEADGFRAKRRDALLSEHQSLADEIGRRTREEAFGVARKALADLASANLEDRMIEVFLSRLRALSDQEKDGLKSAFREASSAAIVRSAFDLAESQRSAIGSVVKEMLAVEAPIHFETVPGLVCGVEFTANGRKITWSVGDYLASLGKSVGELLEAQAKPAPSSP